jgi:hypothetical protein
VLELGREGAEQRPTLLNALGVAKGKRRGGGGGWLGATWGQERSGDGGAEVRRRVS